MAAPPSQMDETRIPTLQVNGVSDPSQLNSEKVTEESDPEIIPWIKPVLPKLDVLKSDSPQLIEEVQDRFWKHIVKRPYSRKLHEGFWPQKLVDHIFNETVAQEVLPKSAAIGPDLSTKFLAATASTSPLSKSLSHFRCVASGSVAQNQCYRYILAVLVLIDRVDYISSFIEDGISDSQLPVGEEPLLKYFGMKIKDKRWANNEIKSFQTYQGMICLPVLVKPAGMAQVNHYHFVGEEVPWHDLSGRTPASSRSPTLLEVSYGGYGEVRKVVIHAWQHDFQRLLEFLCAPVNFFALKKLHVPDEKEFEQEAEQLTRFGGRHAHIVTLLSKITHQNERYLLFPWAECDLLGFWRRNFNPILEQQLCKWMLNQLQGITEALAFIHIPNHRNAKGEKIYGRHGDIKPENILWFQDSADGKLVLSDLGLTKTHSKMSRSNRPGETIPRSPDYRPPECDIDGVKGHVSRSFDIWTLGCLILEFLVWALDGWKGLTDFQDGRLSPYINGVDTLVYFELMRIPGSDRFAFKIKDSVYKEFDRLRNHAKCSQMIRDVLDLVQKHMLIIEVTDESPQIKRIAASELLVHLKEINTKSEDQVYCLTACSSQESPPPCLPVEAPINQVARKALAKNNNVEVIPEWRGRTRTTGMLKPEEE